MREISNYNSQTFNGMNVPSHPALVTITSGSSVVPVLNLQVTTLKCWPPSREINSHLICGFPSASSSSTPPCLLACSPGFMLGLPIELLPLCPKSSHHQLRTTIVCWRPLSVQKAPSKVVLYSRWVGELNQLLPLWQRRGAATDSKTSHPTPSLPLSLLPPSLPPSVLGSQQIRDHTRLCAWHPHTSNNCGKAKNSVQSAR